MAVAVILPESVYGHNKPHPNKAAYSNLAIGSKVQGLTIREKLTVYILEGPGSFYSYTDSMLAAQNAVIGS